MVKKLLIIFGIIILISNSSFVFAYKKTLGLTDKEIVERLSKLEEGQKAIKKQLEISLHQIDKRFEQIDRRFQKIEERFEKIDKRFEQIDKRIDDLINFMNLLGIIFSGLVIGIIGFALWARRTIVKISVNDAVKEIEKEGSLVSLIKALRQLAKDDERLANVLKQYNLL